VSSPEDRDVVFRPRGRQTLVYCLRIVPGPDQFHVKSVKDACSRALDYAERAHVGAWMEDADGTCVLLRSFRIMENLPSKSPTMSSTRRERHTDPLPRVGAPLET
jgi:hypothetical protein